MEQVLPPNFVTLHLTAFETPLMKAEFDRVASRQPMDTLSMKRYELPTPPAGKMTDVAAWNECVDNSMAQLEHQRTRITNLELMSEYGCESWKVIIFSSFRKIILMIFEVERIFIIDK